MTENYILNLMMKLNHNFEMKLRIKVNFILMFLTCSNKIHPYILKLDLQQ